MPEAGIVDFRAACVRLAQKIQEAGGRIVTRAKVVGIEHHHDDVVIETTAGEFSAKLLVNCAGLHCDRVTRLTGHKPKAKIIPFRGEYYELLPEVRHLCRNLIYPVPDPRFPFLGVHFTRRIDGVVEVGPNAVLALGREHYRGTKAAWSDVREVLGSREFRRLVAMHWRAGAKELLSSRSTRLYARLARSLVPGVRKADSISSL